MNCPDCQYNMSAFDAECPRCARYGKPSAARQPTAEPPFTQQPYAEPAPPPPVEFVPSPYPPRPPGTPAQPMPQVMSVFLGIMLSIAVIIIIMCVLGFVVAAIRLSAK